MQAQGAKQNGTRMGPVLHRRLSVAAWRRAGRQAQSTAAMALATLSMLPLFSAATQMRPLETA